ncbi:S-adenosyl-L-methionine-dependent methyltransferases superfamily protein [Wolffia australiana]
MSGDMGGAGEDDGRGREAPAAQPLPSFERLDPARFVVFSFPNPVARPLSGNSDSSLRVAVLDSPTPFPSSPATAGMLVPLGRESDWLFCTAAGHLQLLLSSSAARLVLVGRPPLTDSPPPRYARHPTLHDPSLSAPLRPLLLALCPRSAFRGALLPDPPFLSYEDGLVRSAVVEIAAGQVAGEMVAEDVEVELAGSLDRRRRLRFKRMPNLVQTQMRLLLLPGGRAQVDPGVLVQPYLAPMVAGLLLLLPGPWTAPRSRRRRALCLGVGGGALLTFLERRLGFHVLGVEADEAVLALAKRHFGLAEGEFLRVTLGDAMDVLGRFPEEPGADAIMVDLDAAEPGGGGIVAPPAEFARRRVIASARDALRARGGVLVINVAPPAGPCYAALVECLREHFPELYQIDVANGENVVLVAALAARRRSADGQPAAETLRQVLGDDSTARALRKI